MGVYFMWLVIFFFKYTAMSAQKSPLARGAFLLSTASLHRYIRHPAFSPQIKFRMPLQIPLLTLFFSEK